MKPYQILLYYQYTPIDDPETFREEHHLFGLSIGITGRIIVAQEGLNGTVSGSPQACQAYMKHLQADTRFADIDFKIEESDEIAFQKLYVRVKPEIVHSGLAHIKPQKKTGIHLSPEEFKKLKDAEDVVILDVRSKYEHAVGKFKNAHTLDIDHFREFPQMIPQLEEFKNKKVITYCTGGVKCEKASAYLLEQGFGEVYQLHGGIIKYGLEQGGEDFEGKCYVFDNRITTEVNQVNPSVISTCYVCGTINDRMVNCANPHCNRHVALCTSCGEKLQGACSDECKEHPDKRPYDGTGYYQKELNGYDPYLNVIRRKTEK